MLFINACIAGGVVYAGLKTLSKRRPRKKTLWLVKLDRQEPGASTPVTRAGGAYAGATTISHYLTVTSVSLGLSISGALFYAPLSLFSVPLTVYGAIPMFEGTYAALGKGQLKMVLVESVVVVETLASQYYVLPSLLIWLHYYCMLVVHRLRQVNEILWHGLEHDYSQFLAQVYGIKPRSVWVLVGGVEVGVPFEQLRVGDIVVVNEGDAIPVEGTVVEGTAEVRPFMPTGQAQPVAKRTGDRVGPATLVCSGKIYVRTERL